MTVANAPVGVMNIYATPAVLKDRLGLKTNGDDATLWHLLHVASRIVDGHCGRRFYVSNESKRFDVIDRDGVMLDDLIEIGQVVEDWDGDGVFERTRHRSDYELYPLGAHPKSAHGYPFHVMRLRHRSKAKCFPQGRATMQITGRWGYRSHFVSPGRYVSNSGATVTQYSKSIRVDKDTDLAAGQTILIDNEQMFVTQVGSGLLNVMRGINGTSAAQHLDASEVKVLQFPAEVVEATLLTAVRRWHLRDGEIDVSDDGNTTTTLVCDPTADVKRMLARYRRLSV